VISSAGAFPRDGIESRIVEGRRKGEEARSILPRRISCPAGISTLGSTLTGCLTAGKRPMGLILLMPQTVWQKGWRRLHDIEDTSTLSDELGVKWE
jgi:hypothetical protein